MVRLVCIRDTYVNLDQITSISYRKNDRIGGPDELRIAFGAGHYIEVRDQDHIQEWLSLFDKVKINYGSDDKT